VLNRLCALRMAEARGILIESITNGYKSKGFQLYARLAETALGETGDAYRCYLFSVFDEFALDLAVLFDRFSTQGRLFPRETTLLELLGMINHPDIASLWAEDETIGWIYQYFNSTEERRQMRDESPKAPRNSRELAVRNQFFTPRYVVEFLTDNTLGQIWYEMTRGNTVLKNQCRYLARRPNEIFLVEGDVPLAKEELTEGLSQEDLLKQSVFIPFRQIKDPREIRMLDPACGSMHFGLYAFDLFLKIYEEAWELEGLFDARVFSTYFKPLRETYENKEALIRDVPRLIIEHNIHGVDIDPRAVQIAGLSLWLRAQRSWHDQGVKPQDRPRIHKSNVVCAEPMPGEKEMLREFTESIRPRVLGQLVEIIFDKMKLAGEAGSLLKIEEEIEEAVAEAREEFNKELLHRYDAKESLFTEFLAYRQKTLFDFTDLPDKTQFWNDAEQKILNALREYAEQAYTTRSTRKLLFARDAARGFAFIDICQKRYDVVLMNPPFGEPCEIQNISKYINGKWKNYSKNLACAFILLSIDKLCVNGRTGIICDRSVFFRKNYNKIRAQILRLSNISFADLGWNVMDDANVEASAIVFCSLQSSYKNKYIEFFDVRNSHQRNKALRDQLIKSGNLIMASNIASFPNSAFAHTVCPSLIGVFENLHPASPEIFTACNGMSACDSPRFLRLWWEISSNHNWVTLAHGGEYSPYTRPYYFVVNWKNNGAEIKEYIIQRYPYLNGDPGWVLKNENLFFKRGLTYGKRAIALSVQLMPEGCIFSDEGQAIFPAEGIDQLLIIGFMNSRFVKYILNTYCGQHKHSGYLNKIPWLRLPENIKVDIIQNTKRGIVDSLNRERKLKLQSRFYYYPNYANKTISDNIKYMYICLINDNISFLKEWLGIQVQIETILGISMNDTDNYMRSVGGDPYSGEIVKNEVKEYNLNDLEEFEDNEEGMGEVSLPKWHYGFAVDLANQLRVSVNKLIESFRVQNIKSSYIIDGASILLDHCLDWCFGRGDIRYATGEKETPELPDPFNPLPICPPGMLQNAKGLPAEPNDVRENYPLRISWGGILVDDEGHNEDVINRVRESIEAIWKNKAGDIEQEASEILGVRLLRDYFRKPGNFFANHLKRYSKSRRQAPIYWPISTASGSYTLWLYYHRLTNQTLYICVNDFIEPKLKQVAESVSRLRQKSHRSSTEEKELERESDLELELKDFRDELLRIAVFWKPNLNDGVQITAAPLWNFFRHIPWQKTLKDTWQRLERGEYDWAHLAYSIWPERVRDKCKNDKSIALAHGLGEPYKGQSSETKKKRGGGHGKKQ